MSEKLCIHCFISGRVQGVWYRKSAQDKAKELGLTGWAKNLPDGRVEVLACGSKSEIKAFHEWLQKGPPLAKVNEVMYEELSWQEYDRFGVL